jgi:SsrA-binding protein
MAVAQNKKAYHDYEILEEIEAGVELFGPEVKSLRQGRANIKGSFVKIDGGQAFILKAHITPYDHAHYIELDPDRPRRLLLKKKEIRYLEKKIEEKGLTVVPLKIYFKKSWAKILIGVGRGKSKYDKRESLKKKAVAREIDREQKKYLS